MITNKVNSSPTGLMLLLFTLINVLILEHAFTVDQKWYWALVVTIPSFTGAAIYHKRRKKSLKAAIRFYQHKTFIPDILK